MHRYQRSILVIISIVIISLLASCKSSNGTTCSSGIELISRTLRCTKILGRFEEYILDNCEYEPGLHNWVSDYYEEDDVLRFTYTNADTGTMAIFDYRARTEKIDHEVYYRPENIQHVFQYYENVQEISSCSEKEGMNNLHELSADANGKTYLIRYWTFGEYILTFLDISLVVPSETPDLLDLYSEYIYPDFMSCEQ
jgi:hypothetical protein